MRHRLTQDSDLSDAKRAFADLVDALDRYLNRRLEDAVVKRPPALSATALGATQTAPPVPPAPNAGRLAYSTKEAAAAIGVSKTTLWRLKQEGRLRTFKLGHRTLIHAEELERLLKGGG